MNNRAAGKTARFIRLRSFGLGLCGWKDVSVMLHRAVRANIVSKVYFQIRADRSVNEPPLLSVISNLIAVHADRDNASLSE